MLFLCCSTKPSNPSLIHANGDMATTLGLQMKMYFPLIFTFSGTSIPIPNLLPCVMLDISLGIGLDNWVMARYKSH
jgi:hypothetical protein